MAAYRATFEVDGDCSWPVEAASEEEARQEGIRLFRADRFWAQRYPETPTCTVQLESELEPDGPSHGDIGPFK